MLYGNDVGGSTAAPESETFYDVRRRPERMLTLRNAGVGPSAGEIAGRPLNAVSVITDQALVWDASSNLLEVLDARPGDEWPAGFRPASYRASHDALYRVTGVELDYTRDDGSRVPTDSYVNYRDELAQVRAADPMQPRTAPRVTSTPESRPSSLTYEYDWLANTVESTDDAYQFTNARSDGSATASRKTTAGPARCAWRPISKETHHRSRWWAESAAAGCKWHTGTAATSRP